MTSEDPVKEALLRLQQIVHGNLEYQHHWTSLKLYTENNGKQLTRPLVSGIPPNPIYISPDAAAETTKTSAASSSSSKTTAKNNIVEFVLPLHIEENITLKMLSDVFDNLPHVEDGSKAKSGDKKEPKRICAAVVSGDSSIVYYIIHDGVVKPRQN